MYIYVAKRQRQKRAARPFGVCASLSFENILLPLLGKAMNKK